MTIGTWLLCAALLASGESSAECPPNREELRTLLPGMAQAPLQEAKRRLNGATMAAQRQ